VRYQLSNEQNLLMVQTLDWSGVFRTPLAMVGPYSTTLFKAAAGIVNQAYS
jgi:hypothetical protein